MLQILIVLNALPFKRTNFFVLVNKVSWKETSRNFVFYLCCIDSCKYCDQNVNLISGQLNTFKIANRFISVCVNTSDVWKSKLPLTESYILGSHDKRQSRPFFMYLLDLKGLFNFFLIFLWTDLIFDVSE